MYAPWMRCSFDEPTGEKSMSPWPSSDSAPFWSRITRESVCERHREGDPRRDVGLDHARDDVDARGLRGEHEVDADRAGLLGEADDRVLDVGGRDHHQVGELVDDAEDVRQRLVAVLDAVLLSSGSERVRAIDMIP